jgi:hypothetical protein
MLSTIYLCVSVYTERQILDYMGKLNILYMTVTLGDTPPTPL